ncbi:MAG: GDSL-type esterase/lipase family protein [Saccharospirillum sp.]|jgi:lysophospholipase L1-like esterase
MTDLNVCILGDAQAKGTGANPGESWVDQLLRQVVSDHGPLLAYNLGVPGETSLDVARRLPELTPRLPQGADNRLILCFGLTDATGKGDASPLPARESMQHLITIIKAVQGRYKVLMVGPPAVYDPAQNARLKRLNQVFHDVCQKARLPYVDVFTNLIDDVQYRRELMQGDRLHPGEKGHHKLFELVSNDRAWWFG